MQPFFPIYDDVGDSLYKILCVPNVYIIVVINWNSVLFNFKRFKETLEEMYLNADILWVYMKKIKCSFHNPCCPPFFNTQLTVLQQKQQQQQLLFPSKFSVYFCIYKATTVPLYSDKWKPYSGFSLYIFTYVLR